MSRLSMTLIVLLILGYILYIGQGIIVPVLFSMLLAILLIPVCDFLQKRLRFPKVLATLVSVIIAFLFLAGIIYFLSAQISNFMQDMPAIKKQLAIHIDTLHQWIDTKMNISRSEQDQYLDSATSQLKENNGMIGQTFLSITGSLFTLFLLPIYTFLVLFYRSRIREFLIDVFKEESRDKVKDVISHSRTIVQSYMSGLLIEMVIVAVVNCAGFLILGIRYAIFLGVLAAILNLIPYVGMIIATVICMLVTVTTSQDLSQVLYVVIVLGGVQFIDNNILMPRIVGSKVRINALVTILGVLIGGTLAGVAGMFLSIPAIAIMKAVFDRVDDLKPWGYLLGDNEKGAVLEKPTRGRKKKIVE